MRRTISLIVLIALVVTLAAVVIFPIPVSINFLTKIGVPDFTEVSGVSVVSETDHSVIVRWGLARFELLDSAHAIHGHALILQAEFGQWGGWQYYLSNKHDSPLWETEGKVPSGCLGVKGKLIFTGGLDTFFLAYQLESEKDLPSLCYWKQVENVYSH